MWCRVANPITEARFPYDVSSIPRGKTCLYNYTQNYTSSKKYSLNPRSLLIHWFTSFISISSINSRHILIFQEKQKHMYQDFPEPRYHQPQGIIKLHRSFLRCGVQKHQTNGVSLMFVSRWFAHGSAQFSGSSCSPRWSLSWNASWTEATPKAASSFPALQPGRPFRLGCSIHKCHLLAVENAWRILKMLLRSVKLDLLGSTMRKPIRCCAGERFWCVFRRSASARHFSMNRWPEACFGGLIVHSLLSSFQCASVPCRTAADVSCCLCRFLDIKVVWTWPH